MPNQSHNLRVGLVGFGFAGQTFHAPVLASVPGLTLAAVASSQPDKVRAAWPEAHVFPDVAALLDHGKVDLVVVAAPNSEHHPVAHRALSAGRHVVVDKPFTLDAAQARELAQLAQHQSLVLSVYQNRRFDSDFLTLRGLLEAGDIGRPVYLESRIDRFRPGVRERWREQAVPGAGLWLDLGAHLVDQALQLFGRPDTLQVDTAALRDNAQVEDYFHAVLRYETGQHAPLRVVLHATSLAAGGSARFVLHGTRGSYVKHGEDPQEAALRAGGRPGDAGWGVDSATGELTVLQGSGVDGTSSQPLPNAAGNYARYYAKVRDAIRGAGPNPVPPLQAVELMEMLDLGRQSAAEGRALAAR